MRKKKKSRHCRCRCPSCSWCQLTPLDGPMPFQLSDMTSTKS
jgi:hypothetical protein